MINHVSFLTIFHNWKFDYFKHYTSLKLVANILGVPSPKEDMGW